MVGITKKLSDIARYFGLKYNNEKYEFIICSKREIIVRNFISGCPDPVYVEFRNRKRNIHLVLKDFLDSQHFKDELKRPHACVVYKQGLKKEINITSKIPEKNLRENMLDLYRRIESKMNKVNQVSLIWNPSLKEKEKFNEILLHEFIHVLIEDNKLRPKSWKWNEGLVTYMTHWSLGKENTFLKPQKKPNNKMWNIYANYTHKWMRVFKETKTPEQRRKKIEEKLR